MFFVFIIIINWFYNECINWLNIIYGDDDD